MSEEVTTPEVKGEVKKTEAKGPVDKGANAVDDYKWMLRPCQRYKCEYKDCKSWSDRFHQYWVDGRWRDCEQWNTDYVNCLKFEETRDTEALAQIVESEKSRIRMRLRGHYNNDVWKDRESPPEDWAKPLPEDIRKGYEGSFLQIKSDQLRQGLASPDDDDHTEFIFSGTKCTIL